MIPNKAELEEYYIIQRFSSRRISEFCEIGHTKVLSLLREYDIHVRTKSEAQYGNTKAKGHKHTEESKQLMSKNHADMTGYKQTEEHKQKISKATTGKNNPFYGKHHTDETKQKLKKASGSRTHSYKTRCKISQIGLERAPKGDKHYNWQGGISYGQYCPAFDEKKKEEIRDKYCRICLLCFKTEEENGRKLDVHHIDYNKEQGCNGHEWHLVPLCHSCHGKSGINREEYKKRIKIRLEVL